MGARGTRPRGIRPRTRIRQRDILQHFNYNTPPHLRVSTERRYFLGEVEGGCYADGAADERALDCEGEDVGAESVVVVEDYAVG